MVYIYVKKSKLQKYIKKKLSNDELENILIDMGMDLKDKGNGKDSNLKIEITAERLDLISPIGIARAINFYIQKETKLKEYKIKQSKKEIYVNLNLKGIREKTVGVIIKNLSLDKEKLKELIDIQEKIHMSFGRNRKKAAIGIYPLNKIKFPLYFESRKIENINFIPLGGKENLNAREILEKLDIGKKYSHLLKNQDRYPIYLDSNKNILSMPPIINSENSGKIKILDKDFFIEISGHNLTYLDNILKVLTTTLIDMGAEAEAIKIYYKKNETYKLNLSNTKETLNFEKIQKIIGIKINKKDIKSLLNKMMYKFIKLKKNIIYLEIPCFKTDIFNDIDIIDDIAKAYGYNNITPKTINIPTVGTQLELTKFKEDISKILIGLGFLEVYTYILSSSKLHIINMNLTEKKQENIKLIDTKEQGINLIRTMILPDNLQALHINRKNKYPQNIFEIGWTIHKDETKENKTFDQLNLSISIAGTNSNYTLIKEILDTIFKLLEIKNYKLEYKKYEFLIEGRSSEIYINSKTIGFIGEINPKTLDNFSILVPISSLEINLTKLFKISYLNC